MWNGVYGFDMEVGENTLIVTANFADGRATTTEQAFTVAEGSLPPTPAVTVNKTIIASGEYPLFTIDTTGADEYYVACDGSTGEGAATGDQTQWMAPYVACSGATFRFRVRVDAYGRSCQSPSSSPSPTLCPPRR